jgi:hypothetical protein
MADILHIKAAIQKTFSNIGKTNGSKPPESTSNTFGIAYELFVADALRSAANKRYEEAKIEAAKAGVLGDKVEVVKKEVKFTLPEGSNLTLYSSEHFDITAKVANGSTMLDATALGNELVKKLGPVEALKIIEAASKPRKGATTVSTSMKV